MASQVINTRYEILEVISEAGISPFSVSKARDIAEGRLVTFQVLAKAAESRRQAVRDAASEAMRLIHPAISRVYDIGETPDGDLYLVSEYIRGITLQERIRRVAPFSLSVAADIAVSVGEALEYAHKSGVAHGDLRASDVLLSPESAVKVTNFAYMRQAAEGPADQNTVSQASDLHEFGAIIFEMLTGTAYSSLNQEESTTSPRMLNPGVPQALDGIVQKALQSDAALSYPAAGPLLEDLRAVQDALRTGRSLAWSPLAETRTPRPALTESTSMPNSPSTRTKTDPRRRTATDAGDHVPEKDAPNWLGRVLLVLFVLAAIAVSGVVYYFMKYLAIPNDIQVPSLIGKTLDDARQLGQEQHFKVIEGGSDYSTKWPENQIYQQDPPADRTVKADQAVTVFVSLGPRLLRVPLLLGMTKDRALQALQDAGVPEGAVTEQYSGTVQKGIVISQQPEPNSMVDRQAVANFIVSKGVQPPAPPENVHADAPAFDTVNLTWTAAPRATSYTIYRMVDGDTQTIAQDVAQPTYTDKGLQADTFYSYTVVAANESGNSDPSDPAIVTTPVQPGPPPVLGTVQTQPAAAGGTSTDAPDHTPAAQPPPAPDSGSTPPVTSATQGPARMRQFSIKFRVPRRPRKPRLVEFEVQDITGTNLVYQDTHEPGDEINQPIQAFGNRVTFRIFLDGKLIKQATL